MTAALMAVLIFGALALAVDLGVQTMSQRSLQNIGDAGALAGATDLGANVTTGQQQTAVNDALATVRQNLGGSWSGGTPKPTTCGSGYCALGTDLSGNSTYSILVSTPPAEPRNTTANGGVNDLEVDISTTVGNGFAGVIGVPTSKVAAHAVAYHMGPPEPYDYTFFAAQATEFGNQQESILGDAYVGDGYQAQSSGQAGLCVYYVPNTTSYGHLIYGEYPPSIGGEPTYSFSAPCPGGGALTAQAAEPSSSNNDCPSPSTPVLDPNTGSWGCVMPNPSVPSITGASCQGGPWWDPSNPAPAGTCQPAVCNTTFTPSTTWGIYPVKQNCTVTLQFSTGGNNGGDINCVSLELNPGASVKIVNKKLGLYMTSYGFQNDSTSDSEVMALDAAGGIPYTQPPDCTGSTTDGPGQADDCVICAPPSTVSPMPVALVNNSTGCCSDTLFIGSVFLPGQEIFFNTNQAMEDVGQVYCGTWDVQSGNHPNPLVTRDVANTGLQPEVLRLVE